MARRIVQARVVAIISMIIGAALGCGSTYHQAHEFQGQVYYTEETVPDVGARFVHAQTHDCKGGVRDDERALRLVPTVPGCKRDELTIDYVPDGIHRIAGCNERWKIQCSKRPAATGSMQVPPNFPSEPLGCVVECSVEDHFVSTE